MDFPMEMAFKPGNKDVPAMKWQTQGSGSTKLTEELRKRKTPTSINSPTDNSMGKQGDKKIESTSQEAKL
ncbi:unnamed protein product [Caenorhabditis nigoni]